MSNQGMTWQRIAAHDPFLAGAIAARGWQWFDEETAESQADSVKLTGEPRSRFLAGWQFELDEQEQARLREREAQFLREYDEMSAGYEKGDPAYWM